MALAASTFIRLASRARPLALAGLVALATAGCVAPPGGAPTAAAASTVLADAPGGATSATGVDLKSTPPDVSFFDKDNQTHHLSEYKGKFLALVFFAYW